MKKTLKEMDEMLFKALCDEVRVAGTDAPSFTLMWGSGPYEDYVVAVEAWGWNSPKGVFERIGTYDLDPDQRETLKALL